MSSSTQSKSGSLWRRWDLHIHTPKTKLNDAYIGADTDEIWNDFIDIIHDCEVEVFGITDYFSYDTYFEFLKRYRERKPDCKKTFFVNIEFRLSESISKDGSHPDIHVIFDNSPEICNAEQLNRFLTNLETQSITDANIKTRCSDLKNTYDFESCTVSLDNLTKALKETFGDNKPYILVFPANNNGLRSTDTNSRRKVSLADRIDRTCDIFFGSEKNRDFLLKTDRYETGEAEPKPVVSGCDAHSFDHMERLTGDVAGFPPTWIKADTTFAGLKQICYEPESRVYIGEMPDVLVRQAQDATKFLDTLRINSIAEYDGKNGEWFKDVEIPLNPELTAIIGNKGSGKSALVDIIGLLGESRQEEYFSFLTDKSKSKKFRQKGYAENFEGEIKWHSGQKHVKKLSESHNPDNPESVRYLPQNYFEQLTNEIEIEQFRSEIEDVVFSHVDETDQLGKSSFSELEEAKTLQSKQEISSLKKQLRELNLEIVKLEEQSTDQYKRQLQEQIKLKEQELLSLDNSKPEEVPKPDDGTSAQVKLAQKVDELTSKLLELRARGQKAVAEVAALKANLQEATALRENLNSLTRNIQEGIESLRDRLSNLGIEVNDIVQFSIDPQQLEQKIRAYTDEISQLETTKNPDFIAQDWYQKLTTLPDMRAGYAHLEEQINKIKQELSTPQRRYQAYVEKLNAWEDKRKAIIGEETDPKPETLLYLKHRYEHITTKLSKAISDKYSSRLNLVSKIYESKNNVLKFYRDLKSSVEARLEAVRSEGFPIEIDSSFVVDRGFRREFLSHIDQRKKGPFRNDQDAQHDLARRLQETNWNDVTSITEFCERLIASMKGSEGELLITDQAYDIKNLYDYIFSLDYLSSKYELRLGDKNLNELSPGEKGLLLLIFYLQLDKNKIPLVIDQPEDNLDNDSIFKVLAKCIRDAKKYRQVILVTHNPNLAVGADAEEIIYVKLEKSEKYKFSYESGSIENTKINQRIVDVLEGSQPAFIKRRLKYGI